MIWKILFVICILVILAGVVCANIATWSMPRWEVITHGWPYLVPLLVLCLIGIWLGRKIDW